MSTATSSIVNAAAVRDSYRYCRKVAKERAKNFYYAFRLLDKSQRDAMCAVYAFMRHCDDLSDNPGLKDKSQVQQGIALWRMDLDNSLKGRMGDDLLWPAFCDTVHHYSIPQRFFHEMIDGIQSDIEPRQIETYEELYRYCYQVASVVGMTIIHIFGFESVRALLLAEKSGVAFQLTNILRDVREDAEMGRVYLPREDLRRFGVNAEQLRLGMENDRFRSLMKFEASRAWACYEESEPLSDLIDKKSRRSLWALREVYKRLLRRIEKANYAVLNKRISIPKSTKIMLMLRAFLK
jgi:15-cis-phytoene synthase